MTAGFDLTIRSLAESPDLVPTVVAWHRAAWGTGDPAEALWGDVVLSRLTENVPFTLLALAADEPVGAASVCWDDVDDRFADRGPWLSGMVVRSNARNLGVGRALLAATERRCAELGHGDLWLHTSEAKRFYERCGWRLVADKPGLGRDAVLSRQIA